MRTRNEFSAASKKCDVGVYPGRIMVYLLVGFNTSHEQDYHRFSKLREFEVEPFVMVCELPPYK